jgi:uncharacterized protein YoxC
MLTVVVIIINIVISVVLCYVALRVRRLKQRLARIADFFTAAELSCHVVLHKAPDVIYRSQQRIRNLSQRRQVLERQIQQVRQIMSLLAMGQRVWLRYFNRFQLKKF